MNLSISCSGLSSVSAGAVLVDQYCNPLSDVSLSSISGQLDEIVEKVRKMLSVKNPSHPSLSVAQGALGKDSGVGLPVYRVNLLKLLIYWHVQCTETKGQPDNDDVSLCIVEEF